MKTTVSQKGQITIPKRLRDQLGLLPGSVLHFEASGAALVGRKAVQEDPVSRWRGRGRLPGTTTVDAYLGRVRG